MQIEIVDGKFSLGGENFVIDVSAGSNRRLSDAEAFTLVKTQAFLDVYAQLAGQIKPRAVLELGIFQGGSFVLLDKIFQPQCMSAVEIAQKPVEPLMDYVARTPGRNAHFKTSQADRAALTRIIDTDLGGTVDLVIDDASHLYDLTREAFDIIWPRLAPGGIYVIEDWAWAHQRGYQAEDHPWQKRPAMTNLLFEQIMLLGSGQEIAEIRVMRPLCILYKAGSAACGPATSGEVWRKMLLRGKPLPSI